MEYAKTYFGCTDADMTPDLYIPFENFNTSPHFDNAFFPDEIMSPIVNQKGRFSMFSFLLMKFSNWYDIDDSFVEKMNFNKGNCEVLKNMTKTSYTPTNNIFYCSKE